MAIKHLEGRTIEEINKLNPDTVPFLKRPEVWSSPVVVPVVIGYGIYYIFYAIFWVFKWTFLSWLRPFTDARWLCKIGLHKQRTLKVDRNGNEHYYCRVCHLYATPRDLEELIKNQNKEEDESAW